MAFIFVCISAFPCACYKGTILLGGNVDLLSFLEWRVSLKERRPYLIHNPHRLRKHTTSHQLGNTEMLLKINELIIKYIFFIAIIVIALLLLLPCQLLRRLSECLIGFDLAGKFCERQSAAAPTAFCHI